MGSSSIAGEEELRHGATTFFWAFILAFTFPFRVDFSLGPFTTISLVDLVLVACAVYLAINFALLSPVRVGPMLVAAAVLIPALLAFGSYLWTANTALTGVATVKYCYAALMYFVALQLADAVDVNRLARACVVMLVGWLLGSLAMYLDLPGFRFFIPQGLVFSETETVSLYTSIYTRLGHPYVGQSNDYGPLLAVLGFLLIACGRMTAKPWLIAASWLAFFSSVLTFSRGLVIGLCASLILYGFMTGVRWTRLALVLLGTVTLATVLLLFALQLSVEVADREIQVGDIVESRLGDVTVTARLEGYAEVLDLILRRPLLGYGAGYFDTTHPDSLGAAHNSFLEQWKYFGFVFGTLAIGCYLAIALHFFLLGSGHPFHQALGCAWVFLILTSLVETFFEATTPRAFIYFLLGICVRAPHHDARYASAELNSRTLSRG